MRGYHNHGLFGRAVSRKLPGTLNEETRPRGRFPLLQFHLFLPREHSSQSVPQRASLVADALTRPHVLVGVGVGQRFTPEM
jgi:hypothetical protein